MTLLLQVQALNKDEATDGSRALSLDTKDRPSHYIIINLWIDTVSHDRVRMVQETSAQQWTQNKNILKDRTLPSGQHWYIASVPHRCALGSATHHWYPLLLLLLGQIHHELHGNTLCGPKQLLKWERGSQFRVFYLWQEKQVKVHFKQLTSLHLEGNSDLQTFPKSTHFTYHGGQVSQSPIPLAAYRFFASFLSTCL